MSTPASNIFTDWDFANENVQNITDMGDFLSSESVVIFSGPPKYGTNTDLVPIGLVQNVQVSQNKQMQQLFEIGSRQPFFIPGRTIVQVGISRVLFDGPSLMRALYTSANAEGTAVFNGATVPTDADQAEKPTMPFTGGDGSTPTTDGKFFINLASKFFNSPTGLGFMLHDMANDSYGGFYCENCYFQTHSFSLAGQQTVLLENVGIRCGRIVPLTAA